MKDAICLITLKPNPIWLDFLNTFKHYQIHVVVDDLSYDLDSVKLNYSNITFIQIDNEECSKAGFKNINYMLKKEVSGWDKAIYYFAKHPKRVWFIEEDVFLSSENILKKIDGEYPKDDLLSSKIYPKDDGWSWKYFSMMNIKEPWFHGMMCICRISSELLKQIGEFVKKQHSLVFLEAFFPTLCIQHGLLQASPKELDSILYWDTVDSKKVDPTKIYHPMKDISIHKELRASQKGGSFSAYSVEMPSKKSKGSRRHKQRGGDSASYGFGQAVTPGAPYASEVVAREACMAATRPGTLVNYSAGTGGLPGFAGGSRRVKRKSSRFSLKKLFNKACSLFKVKRRQRGGRWSANVGSTTGGPNPFVPVSRLGCESGIPLSQSGVPLKQMGGVGGVSSPYYAAPTAGYTNMASKWVDSTGTPSLLQLPYEARTVNPACLKTGGGKKSKSRKYKSRKSKSRK